MSDEINSSRFFDPEEPDFFNKKSAEEGAVAKSGTPKADGVERLSVDDAINAMSTVHDPEIPVNIYELGLIYDCTIDDNGDTAIVMTLTAPTCPVAGELPQEVADAVAGCEGAGIVTVTLTWEPPWRPDMMSDDARMAVDFF